MNLLKQAITVFVLISVFSAPFEASAIIAPGLISIPTGPTVPISQPAIETKETGFKIFGWNTGISWDTIAINIAKQTIEKMVDSTVDWINSGFDGNPVYVDDPEEYFLGIADSVAGQFIEGSDLNFLCSPFQQNIRASLRVNYRASRGLDRRTTSQCTITGIQGNYEDFIDDFSNGGWDAWFEITQNDDLNPYGAYIAAENELLQRIVDATNVNEKLLDWGNGFFSMKDENGNIVTPGAAIEGLLSEQLGSGIRQLELADEFDELIGALLGQLTGQIFSSAGLRGSSKVSGGSGIVGGGTQTAESQISCNGLPTNATVGDPVTWVLQSSLGNNAAFAWSGTNFPENATSTRVSIVYTEPGTKTATITATPAPTAANPNPTPITVPCGNSVNVSRYKPLAVACYPELPTLTFPPGNSISPDVVWRAVITGGSGNYNQIQWDGKQGYVPGTNQLQNRIWPVGLDPRDNAIRVSGNTTTVTRGYVRDGRQYSTTEVITRNGTTTSISLTRKYFRDADHLGSLDAKITVFDADPTVIPVLNQTCTPTIGVND